MVLSQLFASKYYEFAAFTDFTFHVTDRFDVQLGGRWSWNHQTYDQTESGPLFVFFTPGATSPTVSPRERSSDTPFTYLFTPSYHLTSQWMVYARLASGYRPGGPNGLAVGVPASFGPDKTDNYEVGVKGQMAHGRISVDASVYYINWQNIQLAEVQPVTGTLLPPTAAGRAATASSSP